MLAALLASTATILPLVIKGGATFATIAGAIPWGTVISDAISGAPTDISLLSAAESGISSLLGAFVPASTASSIASGISKLVQQVQSAAKAAPTEATAHAAGLTVVATWMAANGNKAISLMDQRDTKV